MRSGKAQVREAGDHAAGGEAKSKKFFNCVTTMHQQMLFKYSLRHAAKVPKMPSTFMCTDVENYTAGNNWLR